MCVWYTVNGKWQLLVILWCFSCILGIFIIGKKENWNYKIFLSI